MVFECFRGTEDTFGGVDAAGKVNCQSGRCSDGYEEVVTVEAALVHCQQCPAGVGGQFAKGLKMT